MATRPKRRFRTEKLKREDFRLESPFLRWYTAYQTRGQGECRTTTGATGPTADFMMGELASRRFSLGVDEDGVIVLGVASEDSEAVMSIPWVGAAMLRRLASRDWIALSARDGRVEGAKMSSPMQMRLWLPTTSGLLDTWMDTSLRPVSMRIIEASIVRGRPIPKGEPPLAILPLTFKGRWDKVAGETEPLETAA